MKKIKRFKKRSIIFALIIVSATISCSSDDGSDNQESEDEIDLRVVSGRYTGVWSWVPGDGSISLIIVPRNGANSYNVQYYESINFIPKNNSDGITPDATGTIEIEGTSATIDLRYSTDSPSCVGDFTGTGTRSENGVFDFSMNIDDCNVSDEPATWKFTKRENL